MTLIEDASLESWSEKYLSAAVFALAAVYFVKARKLTVLCSAAMHLVRELC